jgi:hypothetical protein
MKKLEMGAKEEDNQYSSNSNAAVEVAQLVSDIKGGT